MKFVIVVAGTAHDFDVGYATILKDVCSMAMVRHGSGSSLENWELRDRNGSKLMDMADPVSTIPDHGSLMPELMLQRTVTSIEPGETVDIMDAFGRVSFSRKIVLRKRLFTDQRILANVAIDERQNKETRARCESDIAKNLVELENIEPNARLTPDDLVYAATSRCKCGAGLACVEDGDMHGSWACSVVLLTGKEDADIHGGNFPYSMYNIKEEFQPSANGATTRPK